MAICECSPAQRGISAKMKRQAKNYTATHLYKDLALGVVYDGFRNEDVGRLTFQDQSFDLFISLDVMEHIPDPASAFREIWRVLRSGGAMLSTWPVRKGYVAAIEPRVAIEQDGTLRHLKEPLYHGNPIDKAGSLVTYDYGYDISKQIAEWTPLDVRVYRFADRTHGILGEYTEVFLCNKPPL